MITTTFKRGLWTATAAFPHATNSEKYCEYYFKGQGATPEAAVTRLMSVLEASDGDYYRHEWKNGNEVLYRPLVTYDTELKIWYCEILFINAERRPDGVSVPAGTPEEAVTAAVNVLALRGACVARNQSRPAWSLFAV